MAVRWHTVPRDVSLARSLAPFQLVNQTPPSSTLALTQKGVVPKVLLGLFQATI